MGLLAGISQLECVQSYLSIFIELNCVFTETLYSFHAFMLQSQSAAARERARMQLFDCICWDSLHSSVLASKLIYQTLLSLRFFLWEHVEGLGTRLNLVSIVVIH